MSYQYEYGFSPWPNGPPSGTDPDGRTPYIEHIHPQDLPPRPNQQQQHQQHLQQTGYQAIPAHVYTTVHGTLVHMSVEFIQHLPLLVVGAAATFGYFYTRKFGKLEWLRRWFGQPTKKHLYYYDSTSPIELKLTFIADIDEADYEDSAAFTKASQELYDNFVKNHVSKIDRDGYVNISTVPVEIDPTTGQTTSYEVTFTQVQEVQGYLMPLFDGTNRIKNFWSTLHRDNRGAHTTSSSNFESKEIPTPSPYRDERSREPTAPKPVARLNPSGDSYNISRIAHSLNGTSTRFLNSANDAYGEIVEWLGDPYVKMAVSLLSVGLMLGMAHVFLTKKYIVPWIKRKLEGLRWNYRPEIRQAYLDAMDYLSEMRLSRTKEAGANVDSPNAAIDKEVEGRIWPRLKQAMFSKKVADNDSAAGNGLSDIYSRPKSFFIDGYEFLGTADLVRTSEEIEKEKSSILWRTMTYFGDGYKNIKKTFGIKKTKKKGGWTGYYDLDYSESSDDDDIPSPASKLKSDPWYKTAWKSIAAPIKVSQNEDNSQNENAEEEEVFNGPLIGPWPMPPEWMETICDSPEPDREYNQEFESESDYSDESDESDESDLSDDEYEDSDDEDQDTPLKIKSTGCFSFEKGYENPFSQYSTPVEPEVTEKIEPEKIEPEKIKTRETAPDKIDSARLESQSKGKQT